MKVLLHACCAPCLVIPYDDLSREGHEVTAFFFNPNI
ncbi:MAG: epoxyqueuosine reductase QueH, partial [Desulfomonilaceae bacterium]